MAVVEQSDTSVPTLDEVLRRAEGMLPALRERAQEAEQLRRLPDATVKDLFDTGMMRILQPKRYGGYEMDWAAHAEAARVIARACSSTAWVVSVVGAHAAILARMSKQCQDDVWGPNQDQIIATASARKEGTARKVDGGYVVNGTWRFASGVDHADWCMVPAPIGGQGARSARRTRLYCVSSCPRATTPFRTPGLFPASKRAAARTCTATRSLSRTTG